MSVCKTSVRILLKFYTRRLEGFSTPHGRIGLFRYRTATAREADCGVAER
jgi:hypothetical protein